jgi:hypothetical protein
MIPVTFKQNENGDIDLSSGLLQRTTALKEYVAIRLDENLSFFLGEWFLDLRKGVPYFKSIIGSKPDLSLIDSVFRRSILATAGVGTLFSLVTSYARVERKIAIQFVAVTKDGTLITQADIARPFIVDV